MPEATKITLVPILPTQIVAKAFPVYEGPGAGGDVDVIVNAEPYATETAPGEVSIPITNMDDVAVGVVTPAVGVKVGNSLVVVRKSNNAQIEAKAVVAEGEAEVIVENSEIAVRNSALETVDSISLRATEDAFLNAPDGTVVIKDSAGVTLKSKTVKSNGTAEETISDATVNIRRSDNTLIEAKAVKAQGTENAVIDDTELTLNSEAFLNVKADSTVNIQLLNSDDDTPIVPVSAVGGVIKVAVGGESMTVDFSADKLTAYQGENIQFTDSTTNSPTHWCWRFDSENSSILQNPIYAFLTTGLKAVSLLAGKIGSGNVLTKTNYIEILAGFFVDFYTPYLAYDLRLLSSSITIGERIRRSNDNAETNIGFDTSLPSSSIDTADILAHTVANSGFITIWEDQSGNSIDLINTTAANQPRVVNAGVLETSNSLPAIKGNTTLGLGTSSAITISDTNELWFFIGVDISNASSVEVLYESSSNYNATVGAILCVINSNTLIVAQRTGDYAQISVPLTTGRKLITIRMRAGQAIGDFAQVWINDVLQTNTNIFTSNSVAFADVTLYAFARDNGASLGFTGKAQSFYTFKGNQTTNRTPIQTNINDYYGYY